MTDFGVTKAGFVVKPFADILADKAARAREMFGDDVDLRSTSSLRKILDISSAEDHELWKAMERLFYAGFISTARGSPLDLLGEDLGVPRRMLNASGDVKFILSGGAPGRVYHLPVGTLVETEPLARRFRTLDRVSLSNDLSEAVVRVEATERGPGGNVAAGTITRVNEVYKSRHLNLGGATVSTNNDKSFTGGQEAEGDASYQSLLLGRPRALWTLDAVRRTVVQVDGVRDCRLFDPQGGVDVSLSKFNFFLFNQRQFGAQRLLGSPYFFEILVAVLPGFPWETEDGIIGLRETIAEAIDEVRPVSIFPNIRLANTVFVGLRANIRIKSGHDANAVAASIKRALEGRVNALGLGNAVLYAEVMRDCINVPYVVDVQQMHLRRSPPRLATITFGRSERFLADSVEAAIGENLVLKPDEIAVVEIDSPLLDIQVSDR